MEKVFAILGGWLVKDSNGVWRTTTFDEKNAREAFGDRFRVDAGIALYKKYPNAVFIASGGKGKLGKLLDAQTVSSVIKRELLEGGVSATNIIEEDISTTTYEQLKAIFNICKEHGFNSITFISNKYHVPRINAFLEEIPELISLYEGITIEVTSAEDILIASDRKAWETIFSEAYQHPTMKARILREERGVAMLRQGTYSFQ